MLVFRPVKRGLNFSHNSKKCRLLILKFSFHSSAHVRLAKMFSHQLFVRPGRHQTLSLRLRRLFSLFRCLFSRFFYAFKAKMTCFFVFLVDRTIKLTVNIANWTTKLLKFSNISIIPLKSAILNFFRFKNFAVFSVYTITKRKNDQVHNVSDNKNVFLASF